MSDENQIQSGDFVKYRYPVDWRMRGVKFQVMCVNADLLGVIRDEFTLHYGGIPVHEFLWLRKADCLVVGKSPVQHIYRPNRLTVDCGEMVVKSGDATLVGGSISVDGKELDLPVKFVAITMSCDDMPTVTLEC